MKSLLIAALLVLDSGATMRKHHHSHKHHHGHKAHENSASLMQERQKKGMDQDFFKHRNMLNEREHMNVQMYDDLNDKLTDEELIGEAIQNGDQKIVKNSTLMSIKTNATGPFDRSSNPFEQFRNGPSEEAEPISAEKKGPFDRSNNPFEQFRSPPAQPSPTIINATATPKPKIVVKPRSTASSEIVTKNYTETKSKYQLTEGFEDIKCADEGQVCSCLGQIHFGKKADSLSQMHEGFVSIFDTRAGAGGWLSCDAKSFNVTNSTGGNQCYCVREMAPEPLPAAENCADDSGLSYCNCFGTVYYGNKYEKGPNKTPMSFGQMMKNGWTSTISNGDLLCDVNSFNGDPAYGHDKQCFCAADPSYEPTPPVERCANENEECVCQGTVYFGIQMCPYEGNVVDFLEMKDYGFATKQVEGAIGCNQFEFGDPAHGKKKQCFCEQNQEPQVKRCAMEGDGCTCKNGNVFFGLLESEGAQIGFDDFLENEFKVKYGYNGEIQCTSKGFGSDPQPGKAKQCFCDDIEYEDKECIEEKLSFFTQQHEIESIQTEMTPSSSSSPSSQSYRSSQERQIEEESRYASETESSLKIQELERIRLTAEMEATERQESSASMEFEKVAHQQELDGQAAEQDAEEAEVAAETARKAAEAADEKSKYAAQLEANKLAAAAAEKKRKAEFMKSKAEAEAAKVKKEKMKKEMAEKNQLAQLELQSVRTARQAKIRAEKQKMRLESQKLMEEYEANRLKTEAARTQQALQEKLEKAMAREQQMAIENANEKQEKREKRQEKLQREWERKQNLAKQEEERQMAIEKARELRAERLHNATLAQKERESKMEEQRKAEEARIKAQQEAAAKHAREIEKQQLRALRAQAIASTEADIKEAEELAAKLAQEMEDSRKERQALLDQKRDLALEVQRQRAAHDQLVADSEKADNELKAAKALLEKKKGLAQKLKADTYKFVQKMKAQMEKTREAAQKLIAKQKKDADEAREKRIAAAKAAREADEKEHDAQIEARKKLNELQAEQHKKQLEAKKAEFEKTFKHMWGSGSTGLSIVYCTFVNKEMADKALTEAFKDTMVAQATDYTGVTYSFKNETKLHIANPQTGLHVQSNDERVELITSDDRIPELIETMIAVTGVDNLDIVVVQMTDVSPDYAKWVQMQSEEEDQTNAFYNVDAFGSMSSISDKPPAGPDKKIKCKGDFCPCPK